jgi:hypothetical protein
MKSERLFTRSQQPVNCPIPEPVEKNSYSHTCYIKIHFNIILPLEPKSPNGILISGFPTTFYYLFLVSPMRSTRPSHLFSFIALQFLTTILTLGAG